MATAAFTANGNAAPCEVAVTAGSTVNLALVDTDGAHVISWSISSHSESDESYVAPTITVGGTPLGATASFAMSTAPAHGRGLGLQVTCTVAEDNGTIHRVSCIVGIVGTSGLVPLAYQEQGARGAIGWTDWINKAAAAIPGGLDLSAYIRTDVANTVVAQHTFSPTAPAAPFALGANAQGQLVTGFNADRLDGQHGAHFLDRTNHTGADPSAQTRVADYGAIDDGATDDAAAYQAAVDAAEALGRHHVDALDNPLCSSPIECAPGTSIVGRRALWTRNLLVNGNFCIWQRVQVRNLSPAQFAYAGPTFGDTASYEGSSGLPVFSADLWYMRHYGYQGSGVIERKPLTPEEQQVNAGSEFCFNWQATSVVPAAAFNTTITSMSSPAVSTTIVVAAAGHVLSNGDWVYLDGTSYTGGVGTIDGSYQVANVVAGVSFEITIGATDPGFSAWVTYGTATNDPFFQLYEHLYDPAHPGTGTAKWVRNGTASHNLSCRIPVQGAPDGVYTVRLRLRLNSGTLRLIPRIYYDFGSGGTPTATTSNSLPELNLAAGGVQDFVFIGRVSDISGASFGTSTETRYLQLDLAADPTSFDLDVFSVAVTPGVRALPNDHVTKSEAYMYCREFYQGVRVGRLDNATSGNYYGVSHSFDPPMRGTPEVARVRDVVSSNFSTPTVSNNRSREGFTAVAQATATAQAHWSAVFEAEFAVKT